MCSAGKKNLGCCTFRGKLVNRTICRTLGVWLLVASWSLRQDDTIKRYQSFEENLNIRNTYGTFVTIVIKTFISKSPRSQLKSGPFFISFIKGKVREIEN